MKRPTMLIEAILAQAKIDLGLSVERDVETIRRRCKHEGISFLTIQLPTLSDALERGLETGRFSCPSLFARHGSLPRLLGGFFNRVFTRLGELLPDPSSECIMYIRQICRFFKKLKMPCTAPRERAAEGRFLEVEGELRHDAPHYLRKDDYLDKISRLVWTRVFPELDCYDLICRHGPGATAERISLNQRNHVNYWYARWEFNFPSDLHCYPNYGYAVEGTGESDDRQGVEFYKVKDEIPVRVVFVPKTSVTPRVIAIEPSAMQYVQQAVMAYVVERLENHRMTSRSIRFRDQSVNQLLAYEASRTRRLATLDLKDASDRVSLVLVQRIFKGSGISEVLEDARSLHANLPSGRNVILSKYASMGSALCFPVESMVFYTLIQSAMHQLDGLRPTSSSIIKYSTMIDIYGDDIIVPVEYADTVSRYLESYGLKVNATKSFSKGNFRESCGGDFYQGYDVKPVYARHLPPSGREKWEPEVIMSWVSTADQFYVKGQWHVAQVIRDMVQSAIKYLIPRSSKPGQGIFFASLMFNTGMRWNRDLCCFEQRRIVFTPVKTKDEIDGNSIACLFKWSLSRPRHELLRTLPRDSVPGNGSDSGEDQRSSPLSVAHRHNNDDDAHRAVGSCSRADPLVVTGCVAPTEVGINDAVQSNGTAGPAVWVDRGSENVPPFILSELQGHNGGVEPPSSKSEKVDGVSLVKSIISTRDNDWGSEPGDVFKDVSQALDFSQSVKRGGFKPRRRWIPLAVGWA